MNRGSLSRRMRNSSTSYRFNEAPIHESGKYVHGGRKRGWRGAASMRPRFMNRGSTARIILGATFILRFNEAPIHESGKSISSLTDRIDRIELQ